MPLPSPKTSGAPVRARPSTRSSAWKRSSANGGFGALGPDHRLANLDDASRLRIDAREFDARRAEFGRDAYRGDHDGGHERDNDDLEVSIAIRGSDRMIHVPPS